jgi:hypothetical protein
MEAMILGYPPEQAGQISVTATLEEWKIIAAVLDGTFDFAAIAGDLLDHLASVGVEVD